MSFVSRLFKVSSSWWNIVFSVFKAAFGVELSAISKWRFYKICMVCYVCSVCIIRFICNTLMPHTSPPCSPFSLIFLTFPNSSFWYSTSALSIEFPLISIKELTFPIIKITLRSLSSIWMSFLNGKTIFFPPSFNILMSEPLLKPGS